MNEQKIEDLKNSLREVVMLISQREGPLPEDLKVLLVQVMEHVATRIKQLRAEGSVEGLQPEITPELEPGPYPSSNIHAFKYDYPNQKLYVKFQGKDVAGDGPVYSYDGVQPFIYNIFRQGAVAPKTSGQNKWHRWRKGVTPSLGAAMYHLIRNGGYQYQKL